MSNITGQSIAAASDSITRNGKANTALAVALIGAGSAAIAGFSAWVWYHFTNKRNEAKHRQAVDLENVKYENLKKQAFLKHELKKEAAEFRKNLNGRTSGFDPDANPESSEIDASVETYDEVIAGEPVDNTDLRLGIRSFHIGEDCGLIGRTNIGKTTFALQLSICIARNSQENGASLNPEWVLKQPMKVLYFAFEQTRNHFKAKYGKYIKSIPNFHLDVKTGASDFKAIQLKIKEIQKEVGNYRLLVVFDNLTKMKTSQSDDKRKFFQWLEDYRKECSDKGTPITYLKIFHTQGSYKDYMPIDPTNNYGDKTDTYFTQDLVAFGVCKGGAGRLRYIKELKNKLETDGEKQTLSVYRFANTKVPMYDYVDEFEECDVLPSKRDLIRGGKTASEFSTPSLDTTPGKRGPKERYSKKELIEMAEEVDAGFSWREVLEAHHIEYDRDDPNGIANKKKGIKKAFARHGIGKK